MQTPKDVFLDFIRQMKLWEIEQIEAVKKYGETYILDEEFSGKIREKLINIQENFLSKKALSSPQERRVTMSFQEPPEYDQTIVFEKVINTKKFEIITSEIYDANPNDNYQFKYTLVLENDLWKIDKVAYSWMNWKSYRNLF